MADSEFEEFRQYFDQLPQHIRAPAKCYTLAHDITPCDDGPGFEGFASASSAGVPFAPPERILEENAATAATATKHTPDDSGDKKKPAERKRRKLPEIPKNQPVPDFKRTPSLAEELSRMDINCGTPLSSDGESKSSFFRPHYRVEEESPCESDVWPGTDGDSGRDSTEHTPVGSKSSSPHVLPRADTDVSTPSESLCGTQEATHRGLHKFTARHPDEIDIEIGDPVYVHHEADDCWCEGINLRTDQRGIFPSAYVIDVDYDFDPDGRRVNKERYALDYLGSVETMVHKGEDVLCAAVQRIRRLAAATSAAAAAKSHPQPCMLEISDHGIHVTDKCSDKASDPDRVPRHDYFFLLKNVTFCGFHASEPQYLGFITKHPNEERFACHVFEGKGSTRHVAEAIGRAFQRFCRKFIELAYPIHEFYLE